jgi:hypothetical protein
MVLKKKNFKKIRIWKNTISCFFTWEWAKQILVWNYLSDNYNLWNLKLCFDESLSLEYM